MTDGLSPWLAYWRPDFLGDPAVGRYYAFTKTFLIAMYWCIQRIKSFTMTRYMSALFTCWLTSRKFSATYEELTETWLTKGVFTSVIQLISNALQVFKIVCSFDFNPNLVKCQMKNSSLLYSSTKVQFSTLKRQSSHENLMRVGQGLFY